jgi:outer membrane translocation and assembly module TamA
LFPFLHTRVSQMALASLVRASDDFMFSNGDEKRDRTAVRGGWQTATAHLYGYSISPERGVTAGATIEIVRRGFGSFADATVVTGDARLYLPSIAPHHVLAIRLAGGASNGDPAVGRTFLLGGAAPNAATIDFGHEAISLLRGFPVDTFGGSRVALLNADYRWPIVRPQRGVGTWPLFLRTIHGAVFADAGDAWTRSFRMRNLKTSFGAELSLDVIAGYVSPFTIAVGAARGHDGAALVADQTELYFRIGRAF